MFTRLSEKKEVKLILTQSVYDKVKKLHKEELREFLKKGEMFVCKDVKLTFVVAEREVLQ